VANDRIALAGQLGTRRVVQRAGRGAKTQGFAFEPQLGTGCTQ